MKISEVKRDFEGLQKSAFVVGEETRICELVSLILEDLGFSSTKILQPGMLVDPTEKINPELIVWDLSDDKELSSFNNFMQKTEQASMKKMKFMILGGPEVKKIMETTERDSRVYFCLKPFSPSRFRDAIAKLNK